MRFEIEFIERDAVYVIARKLDPGNFDWPPGTVLAGRRVRGISIPRALDADGKPRTDLFAIEVPTAGLTLGQIVELTSRLRKSSEHGRHEVLVASVVGHKYVNARGGAGTTAAWLRTRWRSRTQNARC